MRIAIVNNFFPPRMGGSAYVSDTLARHYAAAGHEVLVITAAYGGAHPVEERDGIRIVRLPSWTLPETRISFNFDITFALKWGNRKRVFRLLDEFKPDAIHQHGQFFDLTWQSGLWARKNKVPTLLTLHTRLQSPVKLVHGVFRVLDALVVRPITSYNRPTKVIAIDTIFDEYIKKRYKIPDARIEKLAVGVELDRFRNLVRAEERVRVRKEYNLGDGPLIASLGHVIPVRDRLNLVEALPKVLAAHPDTKVMVIGGLYFTAFLDRAKELGVDHALICTGTLPKPEIPGLLAAADMEVHDLQGFGIGIASLEAMAAGTPTVMAERADYFPGVAMTNGTESLLTKPGDHQGLADAINSLIDDPSLAEKVGEAGRQWVFENFDMPKICEANLDILKSISGKG
ncbi:glycosyltransferase family 4 protein [Saccharothrix violaceirubra]|uniref:Glycosyltransferase involved in cell wall biosynthesis n=1 Tax=Saccharothrix violaceirubra TaxID=413306 RepID=A0A7W7TAP9_9PSEU|nr:glycosyltransferase family 4 protein [Saccharothrix violaceirubra]MBB4969147.1 glycosyltransferase involved in cell wall biosynthesis [Saccharothrix violaceirubra]